MTPLATLAAYATGLALVLGAGMGVGRAVGPVGTAASSAAGDHGDGAGHGAGPGPAPALPGGLSVALDGYALALDRTQLAAGEATPFAFTVTGPEGDPLTDYTRSHEKDLHLVVVRRDGTGFQHLHPERDAAGRWSLPLTLPEAGPYKLFADLTPAGRERPVVLAADVTVPGVYRPVPAQVGRTAVVDGYEVTVDGDLEAGAESGLSFTVRRGGRPVGDLQAYLGAHGHLVALREGDLAYLHVHPDGGGPTGPTVRFAAEVPSAGTYRLYLDFRHGDVVRTAPFVLRTAEHGEEHS